MFLSQIISCIILGIIICRINPEKYSRGNTYKNEKISVACAVVSSVRSCCAAMLDICAFIVVFSVILEASKVCGIYDAAKSFFLFFTDNSILAEAVFPSLLEICAGSALISKCGIVPTAFAVAFGGICVHFQIFSMTAEIGISKTKFILSRFIFAFMSAALTKLFLLFSPVVIQSSAPLSSQFQIIAHSPVGTVALFMLCIATLLFIPSDFRVDFSDKK